MTDKVGMSSEVEFGRKKVEDDENRSLLDDSFEPATSKRPSKGVAPPQTKRARKATLDSDGEVCAEYTSNNTYESKLNEIVLQQAKATTALMGLIPEIRSLPPSSVLIELEDLKREVATARSKEKELAATISELKERSSQCASYESQVVALEAENKKTIKELMAARSKETELVASVASLRRKNNVLSDKCASYESQVVALKAENKTTTEKLMVACSNEKEQNDTISRLRHKCATYENNVADWRSDVKYVDLLVAFEEMKVRFEERPSGSSKRDVDFSQIKNFLEMLRLKLR